LNGGQKSIGQLDSPDCFGRSSAAGHEQLAVGCAGGNDRPFECRVAIQRWLQGVSRRQVTTASPGDEWRRTRAGRESGFHVLKAVLLQIGSVLALALGAALVSGWSSAWYVVLGGSAAIIPNSLFALRLALHQGRSPESYPVVFFLGQFAKIGLTAFLLVAIHKWLGPLQWLPLLLGLIVALKAPLFALLYVRSLTGPDDAKPGAEGSAAKSSIGTSIREIATSDNSR
jgi:ATP synthase protein I